jgi:formylglycine-generating enzyme
MKLLVRRCLVVAVCFAAVACGTIAGIDDYTIGECKGGVCLPDVLDPDMSEADGSGPGPDTDDGGVTCKAMPGPPAVRVGSTGNTFCIDTTEVTNAQYDAFLGAKVDAGSQPATCAWNKSFERDRPDGGGDPNAPAVGVDWCDALAYCTWAGKYLCGKVENGKKTGPVTAEGLSDYTSHQWMVACSAEGRLRYPYGGLHDPRKCNLADLDAGKALPVATTPGCIGGYLGIHDLIGNVREWFDGPCKAGALEVDGGDGGPASDGCLLKGGSFLDRGPSIDCRYESSNVRRDLRSSSVGIRCCSD